MNLDKKLADALRCMRRDLQIAADHTTVGNRAALLESLPAASAALAEYDAQRAARPWIMYVPVISTAHISENTDAWLTEYCRQEARGAEPMLVRFSSGYIVHVCDADAAAAGGYPDDLRAIIDWARPKGYAWLRLDRDADSINELATYNW